MWLSKKQQRSERAVSPGIRQMWASKLTWRTIFCTSTIFPMKTLKNYRFGLGHQHQIGASKLSRRQFFAHQPIFKVAGTFKLNWPQAPHHPGTPLLKYCHSSFHVGTNFDISMLQFSSESTAYSNNDLTTAVKEHICSKKHLGISTESACNKLWHPQNATEGSWHLDQSSSGSGLVAHVPQ